MTSIDPTDRPRLWGIGTGRTLRPIWMFRELGIEFDVEPILTRTERMEDPRFRALSGRGKIPILQHGGLILGESAAISLYLADRYREQAVLAPEPGSLERIQHDELCWFTMIEMDAILYTIRRHEGLPEVYGASEVAVRAARAYFLRSAEEFRRRLAEGKSYLMGEEFTVADLLFKTCLDWASMVCEIELPTDLARYAESIAQRPAFAEAMKINFPAEALAALGTGGPS